MSDPYVRSDGAPERRAHILWQLRRLGFLSVLLATGNVLATSAPVPVAPLRRLARVRTDRPVPPGLGAAPGRAGVAVHPVRPTAITR